MNAIFIFISLISTALCVTPKSSAPPNSLTLSAFNEGISGAIVSQKTLNEDLLTSANNKSFTESQILDYTAQSQVIFYNVTSMIHHFFIPSPSPKDAIEGQAALVPYYKEALAGLNTISNNLVEYNGSISGKAQAAISGRYQDLIIFASGMTPNQHATIADHTMNFASAEEVQAIAKLNIGKVNC